MRLVDQFFLTFRPVGANKVIENTTNPLLPDQKYLPFNRTSVSYLYFITTLWSSTSSAPYAHLD